MSWFGQNKRISEELTICAECKHCLNNADFNAGVWYSWFCGAVVNEQRKNFVTGEMEYVGIDKHPNCSSVNRDGQCSLFEYAKRPDLLERIGTYGRLR